MTREGETWEIEPTDPRSFEAGCFPGPTLWRATLFEAGVPSRVFTAMLREDLEWLIADHTAASTLREQLQLQADSASHYWKAWLKVSNERDALRTALTEAQADANNLALALTCWDSEHPATCDCPACSVLIKALARHDALHTPTGAGE